MTRQTSNKNNIARLAAAILSLAMITAFPFAGKAQKDLHGFRLIEKRFVKEVNAECLLYEHVKSGARLFKIAANDPNKTFAIAFKTLPESDCGTTHIIEHSVLNGSKNYPVKSPFDVLEKGSLNTFLNAFTSKDYTMYPFASMNDKDYMNLMHIYLDAVFNPLFPTDPRVLKQEGWHYELTDKDSAIVYKGVVYNEMKGAFSNPSRELAFQVYRNLFPDNGYRFESGGYPYAIPSLTQEAFVSYYKRNYDPENSYIFLYGNGDLDQEMALIDGEYLSKYTKSGNKAKIEDQPPFKAPREVTAQYSTMEGEKTENQTYLSMAIVAGHSTDAALSYSLSILCDLLVNQESAPIRLALQEAGIGQDVSCNLQGFRQNVFQIIVQNANPADKDKFRDIVLEKLKEVIGKGLDKEAIEGAINRLEFQLREGNDAQKGITYANQTLSDWFFGENPFNGLEYEKPMAEVKKALTTKYFEEIIDKYLLTNPHRLTVTLEPKPGLDKEKSARVKEDLRTYKAGLEPEKIAALVKETNELMAYQQREDTPESLATIPMLDIKDINPKSEFYTVSETTASGLPFLYHKEFSNDVVYVNLYFDLRVLPQEMIPWTSLLSNFIGTLSTKKYTYGELEKVQSIHTGGFYTFLNTYFENLDDNKMIPKFVVSTKSMNYKLDKLFELAGEILNNTTYNDTARIRTLLTRLVSQQEAAAKRGGFQYATRRLSSYLFNRGKFDELTNGLDFYWFCKDLLRNLPKNPDAVVANLQKTAKMLFSKDNMIAAVTCSDKDLPAFTEKFGSFGKTLPAASIALRNWQLKPEKKNEGILTASKVQYVIEGADFKKLGYSWTGKMQVLSQVLSTDWLQTRIRVMGGAYGGFSNISQNGLITFNSYRDPNLKETLDNYAATAEYLQSFQADDKSMTRYIIGTIAGIDQPLTTSQKGDKAVSAWFNKRTEADVQRDRDAVLSTTQEDIRGFSKLIKDVVDQHTLCVYGNADKLTAGKDLFSSLVKIDREDKK